MVVAEHSQSSQSWHAGPLKGKSQWRNDLEKKQVLQLILTIQFQKLFLFLS